LITKKKLYVKVIIIILLMLGALFAGFPILWMVVCSFKPNPEIFAWPPSLIPKVFTVDAYRQILNNPEKIRFFLNSYFISLVVVALTLILGILTGYSFSRFDFKGKKL